MIWDHPGTILYTPEKESSKWWIQLDIRQLENFFEVG